MHAVPELTWFKEFINILRHFYDVCTRTAFWPAQQGVLKSTICPPNSTAEWTSTFKRLTTSTIGDKKSLCRRLGCTWYLHQLTPEIWYAISLSAAGHVLEVGWGGLMRMTLADKFVYYQKLFMRWGENVNQTLVGLMGSHVCIYSLLFPDHLVKEKRRAYTSLQINLNLWIST